MVNNKQMEDVGDGGAEWVLRSQSEKAGCGAPGNCSWQGFLYLYQILELEVRLREEFENESSLSHE